MELPRDVGVAADGRKLGAQTWGGDLQQLVVPVKRLDVHQVHADGIAAVDLLGLACQERGEEGTDQVNDARLRVCVGVLLVELADLGACEALCGAGTAFLLENLCIAKGSLDFTALLEGGAVHPDGGASARQHGGDGGGKRGGLPCKPVVFREIGAEIDGAVLLGAAADGGDGGEVDASLRETSEKRVQRIRPDERVGVLDQRVLVGNHPVLDFALRAQVAVIDADGRGECAPVRVNDQRVHLSRAAVYP